MQGTESACSRFCKTRGIGTSGLARLLDEVRTFA
jgi:hypothetical protein